MNIRPKTKKYTTEEIIHCFKKINGDRYDYSKFEYVNSKTKSIIICKKHGEFLQMPSNHLKGENCKKCMYEGERIIQNKHSLESFVEKANLIHNFKYNYSKTVYKNNKENIIIICAEHGIFSQRPDRHLYGDGCIQCAGTYQYTIKDFIEKSNEKHNFKYDYTDTYYTNNDSKVTIKCPKHGCFEQIAKDHLRGVGCKNCNDSKGEIEIRKYLMNKNIVFESQKRFDDCFNSKTNYKLPFDFYLSQYNICIEYDGEQHFEPINFGNYSNEKIEHIFFICLRNDQIKNEYCINNNITLLRIPYWKFKNIETIITDFLNMHTHMINTN